MSELRKEMVLEEFCTEILHEIIRHLSISERRCLKQCSKLFKEVASSAPIFHEEVKFIDCQNDIGLPHIRLQLDKLELDFEETRDKEDDSPTTTMKVFVNNIPKAERTRVFEKANASDVAKKYLRELVIQNNVTCGYFETNYRYTTNYLEDSEIIKSKKLRITMPSQENGNASTDKWLKRMKPETLRFMNVYRANQFFSVIGCEKQLSSLEVLNVIQRSDIDDEVLKSLAALDIELEPARITASGVNNLIHKWKGQSVPLHSQFVYYANDIEQFPLDQLVMNIPNVFYKSPTLALIPISTDRVIQVYVDLSSVNVACIRNISK